MLSRTRKTTCKNPYSKLIVLTIAIMAFLAAFGLAESAYAVDATYKITYDGNGAGVFNSDTGPEIIKVKEVLVNNTEDATIIAPDHTISSESIGSWTAVFYGNGGFVEGAEEKAIDIAISHTKEEFQGWNTAKDGSGDAYAIGSKYTKRESVTLYAQWKFIEDIPINPTPSATRDGYIFDGWYDQAEGGNKIADAGVQMSLEQLRNDLGNGLFAHWTVAPSSTCSVKFYSGDVLLSEQQVAVGTAATAPATPQAPSGKIFAGWDKDFSNVTGDLEVHAIFTEAIVATADTTGLTLTSVIALCAVLAAGLAIARRRG